MTNIHFLFRTQAPWSSFLSAGHPQGLRLLFLERPGHVVASDADAAGAPEQPPLLERTAPKCLRDLGVGGSVPPLRRVETFPERVAEHSPPPGVDLGSGSSPPAVCQLCAPAGGGLAGGQLPASPGCPSPPALAWPLAPTSAHGLACSPFPASPCCGSTFVPPPPTKTLVFSLSAPGNGTVLVC